MARLSVELRMVEGIIKATREGSVYNLERLSDGERAAVLLVGAILVRPINSVIIVDEPEKHLHPAISGPLISAAVRSRPDLRFLFSSHDISLIDWLSPETIINIRNSRVVHVSPEARVYEVRVLGRDDGVPDDIKGAILGSRKPILFIEGEEKSDDKALYGLLFDGKNIVPKGSWESVVSSVRGISANPSYTWLSVAGLIDRDGRDAAERSTLEQEKIYCLRVPTIENLFCGRSVVQQMAEALHQFEGGKTAIQRVKEIEDSLVEIFISNRTNIICKTVTWIVNRLLSERKTSTKAVADGLSHIDGVNVSEIMALIYVCDLARNSYAAHHTHAT